jgi:hypothetical protein
MDEGIAQAVEDWETRPFSGGYRGLHDLADASFSGAIEADGTWCLLINGRVVGVYEEYGHDDEHEQESADIERFEGASATAYEAPHESLPLLFAMQLQDGELVVRHPTSDRPLEETHRELSEQGFTGYLELSEHVLSGDYYVVYQDGRSMNAAFIGNARRIRTGDEAFERATTEVGVYEAYAVPVEVMEVPEPADTGGAADATGGVGGAAAVDEPAPDPAEPGNVDSEPEPADDGLEFEESTGAAPEPTGGDLDRVEPAREEATSAEPAADGVEEPVDERPARDEAAEASDAAGDAAEPVGEPGAEEPAEPTADRAPADPDPASEPERAPPATGGAGVAEAEFEQLVQRVDSLAAEHEQLSETVDRLDELLSSLVSDADHGPFEPVERLSPEEALAETTLLVRYDAESGPKLADVVEGTISEDALAANLRVEPRTTFPADETAVEGQPYETFVEESIEPRFVEWLVGDLPFEIRRANATTALGPLYEGLPSVDRATFGTAAAVEGQAFDATLLTRDGDPVVVARIETDPDPPQEGTYEDLVRAATEVREAHPSLVGAFLVTAGYVDGAELDPVEEATRDRVLSRSKQESYVNLSGGGFHLCVVEASSESFHLEVPGL